jgi:hypothetical protein
MKRSALDTCSAYPHHSNDSGSCCSFPATKAKKAAQTDVDKLLAKEMNNLSVQQREKIFEEVHGVASPIEETPLFITQKLAYLEDALGKIRVKAAYDRALFLSPSYVKSRKLRLMYLRANWFDVPVAAKRMVSYFENKLELFGISKLVKTITRDDLSEDDTAELLAGSVQLLPHWKDRAGRRIFVDCQAHHNWKVPENHVRTCIGFGVFFSIAQCTLFSPFGLLLYYTRTQTKQMRIVWYQVMAALEHDTELQQNGMVTIVNTLGHDFSLQPEFNRKIGALKDLPLKISAIHYCYGDARIRPAIALFQLAMGTRNRCRFRSHLGSHIECHYALLGFGIRSDMMPMNEHGELQKDKFMIQLQEQEQLEQLAAAAAAAAPPPPILAPFEPEAVPSSLLSASGVGCQRIAYPLSSDILIGRGRPFQDFPGNIWLWGVVDEHRIRHQLSNKHEKTDICKEIVKLAKVARARFLRRVVDDATDDVWWEQVSGEVAHKKVSHVFRTKYRKNSYSYWD